MKKSKTVKGTFYDFEAVNIQGNLIKMSEFRGKVILVVNTASYCGYTFQFKGLEALYKKYKDQGFVILGFPCNQFGKQDPKSNEEIADFCSREFEVTFPMFSKIEVNGSGAHPVFNYLKRNKWGILGRRINWNFTKFLINEEGKPVKRFSTFVKPEKIEKDILYYLNYKKRAG